MTQEKKSGGFPLFPFLGGLGLAYFLLMRPRLLTWGTQLGEAERQLPGDNLIIYPNMQATRAVDVAAPVEAVWRWLEIMGRDGVGYYNTERFPYGTRLMKRNLPAPVVGTLLDNEHRVLQVEAPCYLLTGGFNVPLLSGGRGDLTTLYFVEERGRERSRLLIRLRGYTYGAGSLFHNLLREPVDFFQTLNQLNNLKMLAESSPHE